jgi:diaminohydroxyphosphoribosylaminopyrimidine deaminase/5-amino-6-(5-phosphoribosylamino)uracil reductase
LVATTDGAGAARERWAAAGAEVLTVPAGNDGRVPLPSLMEALGGRGVQEVLIEGGAELAWSSVRDGVVDRLVLYLAPKLAGGRDAPSAMGGEGVDTIADAIGATIESVEMIGADIRVTVDLSGGADGVHRDR